MRQMVARLISSWATSLTRRKASSSRLQRVSGLRCSSVVLPARVTTSRRAAGGKLPRPAGAGGVLKARQALGHEAFPPLPDGVAVATQFGGDVLVGRVACCRSGQDDTAAEGQRLGSGAGADDGFELAAKLVGQCNDRGEGARHG